MFPCSHSHLVAAGRLVPRCPGLIQGPAKRTQDSAPPSRVPLLALAVLLGRRDGHCVPKADLVRWPSCYCGHFAGEQAGSERSKVRCWQWHSGLAHLPGVQACSPFSHTAVLCGNVPGSQVFQQLDWKDSHCLDHRASHRTGEAYRCLDCIRILVSWGCWGVGIGLLSASKVRCPM